MLSIALRKSTVLATGRRAPSPVRVGRWPGMRDRFAAVGAAIDAGTVTSPPGTPPPQPLATTPSRAAQVRDFATKTLGYAGIVGTLAIIPVTGWLFVGTTGLAYGLGVITPISIGLAVYGVDGKR